jgi:transcriptional regulator with XRE-family HTH domain
MTQEFLADYLGVSKPAVSKWENGASYPDTTLLPILARLLQIDLNALFDFEGTLSDMEIDRFILDLAAELKAGRDFEDVFKKGITKVREFPNCERLGRDVAILLEQLLQVYAIEKADKYEAQINKLIDRALASEDRDFKNKTILMRIPHELAALNFEKAERMINQLPEPLDKRVWQAEVYLKQERFKEAEKVYEEKMLALVHELHYVLWGISLTSVKQKKLTDAECYTSIHEQMMRLFEMPELDIYSMQLDLEVFKKNGGECIQIIRKMFELSELRQPSEHPFRGVAKKYFITTDEKKEEIYVVENFLTRLKEADKYELIRAHLDYDELLSELETELTRLRESVDYE